LVLGKSAAARRRCLHRRRVPSPEFAASGSLLLWLYFSLNRSYPCNPRNPWSNSPSTLLACVLQAVPPVAGLRQWGIPSFLWEINHRYRSAL
jgi:hypothetical protein